MTDIQRATMDSSKSIEEITQVIDSLEQIATLVAAAVEEQGAATKEISRNVQEASTGTQSLPGEAYYVRVRLPGEAAAEFALIQPMVPTSRPNMIAWIAARNDGATYGQVVSYRFPKDTSVFGPSQVSARIDADPIIASQTTL